MSSSDHKIDGVKKNETEKNIKHNNNLVEKTNK